MDANRFDSVTKFFAQRKSTRRQALAGGAAGLAAAGFGAAGYAAAQEATPDAGPTTDELAHGPQMLFVQSFRSGTITPKEGSDRYELTLESGNGQTIYFSDRPDRVVGTNDTPDFLDGLGFMEDNPPNAAVIVETGPDTRDIAVVELFSPIYDPLTQGVTYEVAFLDNWEESVEFGLTHAPGALPDEAVSFGAASLFIDDCPDMTIHCIDRASDAILGSIDNAVHDGFCYGWAEAKCLPCAPWIGSYRDAKNHWNEVCNETVPECNGNCYTDWVCSQGFDIGVCKRR